MDVSILYENFLAYFGCSEPKCIIHDSDNNFTNIPTPLLSVWQSLGKPRCCRNWKHRFAPLSSVCWLPPVSFAYQNRYASFLSLKVCAANVVFMMTAEIMQSFADFANKQIDAWISNICNVLVSIKQKQTIWQLVIVKTIDVNFLCLSCHWYRGYYVTTRHVMLEQQFKMHHFHYAYREHYVSSILGQLSHGVESPISWPNHVFHVLKLINRASSVELPVADDCRENEWPLVWDEGTWQVAAQSKVTKWQQNLTNTGPSHQYSQTQHHISCRILAMRHVTLWVPNEGFAFATLLIHCHHGAICCMVTCGFSALQLKQKSKSNFKSIS